MSEKTKALQARTHGFHLRVLALCEGLHPTLAAVRIARQLIDAAGAVDSNYRSACRARTRKEFIARLGVVVEEADESQGWLEALRDAGFATGDEIGKLIAEADELIRIFVASRKTAERHLAEQENSKQGRLQKRH